MTAKSPTAVAGFTQGETGGQWYWWTEADDELDIQILRTKTTKLVGGSVSAELCRDSSVTPLSPTHHRPTPTYTRSPPGCRHPVTPTYSVPTTSVTQLSHCITPPPIGTYGWSLCQPPNRFPPTQPHPSYAVHSRLSIPVDLSVREEREREREESENASERSHASTPHTNHTQSHSLTATTDHTSLTAQRLTHSGESRGAPLLRHIWCRGGVLF